MLKMFELPNKLALGKNNNNKLVFSKNNDSRSASRKNNNDGKVDRFSVGGNGVEYAKKSEKLFKSRKSKSEKMSKS